MQREFVRHGRRGLSPNPVAGSFQRKGRSPDPPELQSISSQALETRPPPSALARSAPRCPCGMGSLTTNGASLHSALHSQ